MIYLTTGLPRNGKTLYTIQYIKELSERENRPVFYAGIKQVTLPWQEIDPEKWFDCPQGSIILIDECQQLFRPRGNGSQVPKYVSELETHGHEGHDIFLLTQHPMLIDANVRRLTETHWHVSRPDGAESATVLRFKGCKEQPLAKLADAERMEWSYPKDLYGCYESAKLHTVKRRISVHRIVMYGVPVAVAAMIGWFIYRHWPGNETAQPVASAPGAVLIGAGTGAPARNGDRPKPMTPAEYVKAYEPRIQGLAYSAPIYDEVTKPTRAPVPVGAVIFKGKCRAYTQQGTPLDMPDAMCRQIAGHGFFREFDDQTERHNQPVAVAPTASAALPVASSTASSVPVEPYRPVGQWSNL